MITVVWLDVQVGCASISLREWKRQKVIQSLTLSLLLPIIALPSISKCPISLLSLPFPSSPALRAVVFTWEVRFASSTAKQDFSGVEGDLTKDIKCSFLPPCSRFHSAMILPTISSSFHYFPSTASSLYRMRENSRNGTPTSLSGQLASCISNFDNCAQIEMKRLDSKHLNMPL